MKQRPFWRLMILCAIVIFLLGAYVVTRQPLRMREEQLVPSATQPTSVPVATQSGLVVAVSVKTPEKTNRFTVSWKEKMNACDVLPKAKEEGYLRSVTLSDKYLTQFKTLLVTEINGYQNNWTFKVNDISPEQGCSLTFIQPKDRIDWAFN